MTRAVELPHLATVGGRTRLIVDGEPFLIRGGELGNSSAERSYLAPFWDKFERLNLNAVVAPVYWDVVEPVEGGFDWTSVDELLEDARTHGMRLVLLWFGSWKNSMSCYAPAWVKTDPERFPRCRDSAGRALEILTPFSQTNAEADARAFAALMAHLRETDPGHTVVLVQVENEIGMIPEARDHCPAAVAAWAKSDLAGDDVRAEEVFMADAFARYVQQVAAAGKAELDLPMYTNAALIRPGYEPGQYPSAGPLPHLADVWLAAAPALDFIAPDVYFPNFAHWADAYAEVGPLFVPEALRSPDAAANALYAFGAHGAIGFSPFGIESIEEPAASLLADSYDLVAQLAPLLTAADPGSTLALLPPASANQPAPHRVRLGDLALDAVYERVAAPSLADGVINESGDRARDTTTLPAAAIVVQTGADELVLAGIGVTVTFAAADASVGILSCEEGCYADGEWAHLRWLNGDQTHQGRHVRLEPGRFAVQRVRLYRYR